MPRTAIVPVGGVVVRTFFSGGGTAHIIVDAIGYITSATASSDTNGRYVGVRPARALELAA